MVDPSRNQTDFLEPYTYGDAGREWTLDAFSSALATADGGQLEYAADLCDSMWGDSRIRGVLTTRINALLGYNNDESLEFKADAVKVRKAIEEDWYAALPEPELSKLIRWGLLLGIGFAYRKVIQKNGRWIPRIKVWHPRCFVWDFQLRRWKGYAADGKQFVIEPDDPNWVLFQPFGESRPWAEGLWRTLALYWLIANRGWRSWGKHNDVHGSAGLIGRLPEGETTKSEGAQRFFRDLQALAKNARIVLAHGYELELLEAAANTWNTFESAISKAETAMAITVLGQPLTTEVPNAVQTGATAAIGVRQDYLEFDAEQTSTWAHDCMFPIWALWNFGNEELSPWPKYKVKPKEDLTALATRLNGASDAITKLLAAFREQIDFKALLETFNIPVKAGASFELPPPPPPVVIAPPVAGEKQKIPAAGIPEGLSETMLAQGGGDASGFVQGQAYTDRVAASARDEGAAVLSADLNALLSLVDELPDGPEWPKALRAALLAQYGAMNAADFTRIAERAMILAELAGRHAVLEDL